MRNQSTSIRKISPWAWVYLLSFFVAAIFLLWPAMNWGSNADDAWLQYVWGMKSWGDVLSNVFIPKADRIFLFGTDRPVVFLYYKIARELGMSPLAHHLSNWPLSWLANLAFAWGLISLVRLALPQAKSENAIWLTATLTWWAPSYLISTATVFPDCWLLPGLAGLFWGLVYSSEKPGAWRLGLAALCAFLACQTQEAAWVMLGWSTLFLGATRLLRKPRKERRLSWGFVALPAALAIAQALAYRSLHPAAANRTEFVISFAPSSLIHVGLYYVVMALYAVSAPVLSVLGLSYRNMGVAPSAAPLAFLLTTGALGWMLWRRSREKLPREAKLLFLLPLGGVLCTLPYLIIADRQLIYYSLRVNEFVSAFFAVLVFMDLPARMPARAKAPAKQGVLAALLSRKAAWIYLAGVALAGVNSMTGWNWLKQFGGYSKQLYEQVMALPGVEECSSEKPCCLEIPNRGWNNNEWVVSWLAGAPTNPPFVTPGMPCAKTLRLK